MYHVSINQRQSGHQGLGALEHVTEFSCGAALRAECPGVCSTWPLVSISTPLAACCKVKGETSPYGWLPLTLKGRCLSTTSRVSQGTFLGLSESQPCPLQHGLGFCPVGKGASHLPGVSLCFSEFPNLLVIIVYVKLCLFQVLFDFYLLTTHSQKFNLDAQQTFWLSGSLESKLVTYRIKGERHIRFRIFFCFGIKHFKMYYKVNNSQSASLHEFLVNQCIYAYSDEINLALHSAPRTTLQENSMTCSRTPEPGQPLCHCLIDDMFYFLKTAAAFQGLFWFI